VAHALEERRQLNARDLAVAVGVELAEDALHLVLLTRRRGGPRGRRGGGGGGGGRCRAGG
jgi:hypothetical protein